MTARRGEQEFPAVPAPVPLDEVDRAIVAALRADGRISMRALAESLHISRAGAYTRVQRLEESGVITGYTATIDPQRYATASRRTCT